METAIDSLTAPATPTPKQTEPSSVEIGPQPGPQTRFLQSPADIVIYGGAAGGGKSWGMLLEALRNISVPRFRGVIFRRQRVDIKNSGGLWDAACEIYPLAGGFGTRHNLTWTWPGSAKVQFSHLENESDRFNWQGAEVAMIGFEELTQFSEKQFWYMLSRNRSTCGVRPYIRATCNPDPKSWVKRLIAWWLDPVTGDPIPDRDGVIRWMARVGDELQWADTREELVEKFGKDCEPKSFTFIHADVFDNPALLERDPGYLANLKMLPRVDRLRLFKGNWNVEETAGELFREEWFKIVPVAPAATRRVRTWDLAATEPSSANPDPDWTAGGLISRADNGLFIIHEIVRFRETPGRVKERILNIASQDALRFGRNITIRIVHDPGQAGKHQVHDYATALAGYDVVFVKQNKQKGDKVTAAKPASSQAEHGNVVLVSDENSQTKWVHDFIAECVNFPGGDHDDMVDVFSDGINGLASAPELRVANTPKDTVKAAKSAAESDHYKRALEELARRRSQQEQVGA